MNRKMHQDRPEACLSSLLPFFVQQPFRHGGVLSGHRIFEVHAMCRGAAKKFQE